MDAEQFKQKLIEHVDAYFSMPEGKETLTTNGDSDHETFGIIFDDLAYWIGQTYGL